MSYTAAFRSTLALLLLVAAAPAQDRVLRGVEGEVLGTLDDPEEALGGTFSNPFTRGTGVSFLPSRVFEITLPQTGTGWEETFLLGYPRVTLQPAPVLVLFHGYGGTPRELLSETSYFREAMARGWIVVAPLAAHQYSYGIEYAQRNVEQVFDFVATYLPIDVERIYGVGFSMGGGAAASYAARHLDPGHARFAAIVDHTGTVSLRHTYPAAPSLFSSPLMFGGSPDAFPFDYARASVIDLDRSSGVLDATNDMARNLTHLPVKIFAAAGDPNLYLLDQTDRFHDWFVQRGGTGDYTLSSDTVHRWWTLDETTVLDHLEPIRLTTPDATTTLVETLADRDGSWHAFDVTQVASGAFTPFRWTVRPAWNRLYLDRTRNLEHVEFEPADLGLDTARSLQVVFSSLDPGTVEITIGGYPNVPSGVRRGGGGGVWTWDPATETVTLFESDSAAYPRWTITP